LSSSPDSPWDLDSRAVRAAFHRASRTFTGADAVHGEARARLTDRLEWVKLTPTLIVDAGCGHGAAIAALSRRYPTARVLALDTSPGMLSEAARLRPWGAHALPVAADARCLPLPAHSVDLLFANLLMPWIMDLPGLFAEWRRVLKPGGLVVFTSLGPDTLYELAVAWAGVDDTPHVHGFFDMHDVGDALTRSGLAEPVLDVDYLTVTYPSVAALCRELKACGGGNATVGRRRGLTSPRLWQRMVDAYPLEAGANPVHATVELIFGQAWGTAPAAPRGETVIPVDAIKRRR
jgi:malonyl-CoA O-methyltransferase